MKETRFQMFIAWLYTRYVLRPLMTQGYSIRLSIVNDADIEDLLIQNEWRQTARNEDIAMFDKMYDTEQ